MTLKHHNQQYTTTVPTRTGDRYYAQDRILDFRSLQNFIGGVIKSVGTANNVSLPFIIQGGVVTKGAGDTLDITIGYGFAKYNVEIPDSFASTPPSKTTADLQAIQINWSAQNDMAIASATLDGATPNYVKVAYAEANGNTRNRAKSSGSYAYETSPSYLITVDSTPPTDYEVCLASFVGTAGGAFTINNNVKNILNISQSNFIAEYNPATTYAQDDEVMYLGNQYISMKAANTGKDPLYDVDYWLPQPHEKELLDYWRNGLVKRGGVEDIHNYRDAGYRQYFSLGKLFFSGSNGNGRVFQVYGIHLDDTTETGDATLEAILNDGGSAEYPFIDIFCPDNLGTRVFRDYRGRVPRAIDNSVDTEAIGVEQEDAFQGHWHEYYTKPTYSTGGGTDIDQISVVATGLNSQQDRIQDAITDGVNGTPRTASETRMKNWTEGVPYIIVLLELFV